VSTGLYRESYNPVAKFSAVVVLCGILVPAFVKNYGGQAGAPLIGNAYKP